MRYQRRQPEGNGQNDDTAPPGQLREVCFIHDPNLPLYGFDILQPWRQCLTETILRRLAEALRILTQLYLDLSRCEFFLAGYLNYTEAKAVAGCTVSQGLPNEFRCWLGSEVRTISPVRPLYPREPTLVSHGKAQPSRP